VITECQLNEAEDLFVRSLTKKLKYIVVEIKITMYSIGNSGKITGIVITVVF